MKDEKENQGMTFFERVFDNLTVSIKNIELRVETFGNDANSNNPEHHRNIKNEFAFGGRIKDLQLRTINHLKELKFVQRKNKFEKIQKMVSIDCIELYFDNQKIQDISQYRNYLQERRSQFDQLFKL
jgi:hypothetical protein